MAENKSTLYNSLTALLAIVNTEQDLSLPPSVYSSMYNTASSWLLTKGAEVFPSSNRIIDILQPFLVREVKPVTNGYVELPTNYRNFLDAGISVVQKDNCECGDYKNDADLEKEFNESILKSGCKRRPIWIVDQSEFDLRTTDPYDYPTIQNPIGCFFETNKLKVCPYDISVVDIRCLKNEPLGVLGYTMEPDDTWIYNPSTTIEVGWNGNAASYILRGLLACYGAYAENKNISEFATILHSISLT